MYLEWKFVYIDNFLMPKFGLLDLTYLIAKVFRKFNFKTCDYVIIIDVKYMI